MTTPSSDVLVRQLREGSRRMGWYDETGQWVTDEEANALLRAAADHIRDLEEVVGAALALTDGDEGDNQHRCDVRCDAWSSDAYPLPPCSGVRFRNALSKLRTSEGGT